MCKDCSDAAATCAVVLAAAVASLAVKSIAVPVEWEFPRLGNCHEGMAFSDGKTGVLVWGGGDTVNLTVGRGDLWDHRGGYPWTEAQSYTNMVALYEARRMDDLKALFAKETPPGEPRNPYLLPFGRVIVKIPGAELKRGELDPYTGLAWIEFLHGGNAKRIELAMCKTDGGVFAMKFPDGVTPSVETKTAMEFPQAKKELEEFCLKPAEKWMKDGATPFGTGGSCGGFAWKLPVDNPASLLWWLDGGEMFVRTERSDRMSPTPAPDGAKPTFAAVLKASLAQWEKFWREGARVKVPDPVLQRAFEYGMYRYGAMTDPDGIPAGLQGAWLEDDKRVPWNGDYHFNINVQECYSPSFKGGHFDHLMPLFKMVLSWRPRLRDNARKFVGIDDGYGLPHSVDDRGVNIGGFWTGTIDHGSTAWVADMMMRYVRYSGDVDFLRCDAYDFMKGTMRVYRKLMFDRPDGRLRFPLGSSPEWEYGSDPSFQMAAAHRLAIDLVDAAKLLGEEPDPMWLDVQKRLPQYAVRKECGISIYENTCLSHSHRHHSHLAGFYPFDTIDMSQPEVRKLANRSYTWWIEKGTGQWTGWCVPWASVIHTHFGNARAAVAMLRAWDAFFCDEGHGSHHDSVFDGFTVFRSRRDIMQMDGQCGAAAAVMELLAHEVNGKTEFFKGCPPEWKDVSYENIALPDGRRVSGRRLDGRVETW